MKIVGSHSSVELARRIALSLNMPLVSTRTKRFPDGEFYFKFDERISNEDLVVVGSLYPPQDAHAIELFLVLHTARDLGAKSIKVVIPYLAYSRQDQRYLDGECLSSLMVAEMLQHLGADAIYTVDVHNEKVLNMYKVPVHNLTACGELARHFASKDLKDPLIIAPDAEELAEKRAQYAAQAIGAECDFLEKKRSRQTGEITTYTKELNVQGRDAIIIDDIISTGKTSANAARILKKQGAHRVFVGVTHALLLGDSVKLLREGGVEEVTGTDSVVNEYAKVSVAPILAKALQNEMR